MEGRMELNSFKIYVGLWIYVGPGRTNTRSGVGTRHGTISTFSVLKYVMVVISLQVRLCGQAESCKFWYNQ